MPPDQTNGRVTIAVVGNKVDNLTAIVLKTNATVDDMRQELGEMRQTMAVNEERWRNHDKAHKSYDFAHTSLHKRERSVIGTLILIANGVSGSLSAWWGSR